MFVGGYLTDKPTELTTANFIRNIVFSRQILLAVPGGDVDARHPHHAGGPLGAGHEGHGKNFRLANYKSIRTTNMDLRKATFVFARPHYFLPYYIRGMACMTPLN